MRKNTSRAQSCHEQKHMTYRIISRWESYDEQFHTPIFSYSKQHHITNAITIQSHIRKIISQSQSDDEHHYNANIWKIMNRIISRTKTFHEQNHKAYRTISWTDSYHEHMQITNRIILRSRSYDDQKYITKKFPSRIKRTET